MSNERIGMHRLQELVRLHRLGTGAREAARLLGMSPNTERTYRQVLAQAGLLDGGAMELPELAVLRAAAEAALPPAEVPAHEVSTVATWADKLGEMMDRGLGPRAIYDRLRMEQPEKFKGSYPAVKRLCRAIKRARGVSPADVAIPVDTAAGEVAQVDFVYVGKLYDPELHVMRKAWCFLMVLGFSRHMAAYVVFDQKITTWLGLHVQAFTELGGVVETVVPDNLKSAVIRAAFTVDGAELNRSYRELARHYGFKVDPTPPRAPRKKGKVESAAKYAGNNFFRGREETDVTEVQAGLQRWVREVAGMRTHGTTGRQPLIEFEQVERAALRPLPTTPFDLVAWRKPTVHPDCCISVEGGLYSVPWTYVGQKLWTRVTRTSVVVYNAMDERVATHSRCRRSVRDEHLPEHRRDLRHRSRAYWEERADALGSDVGRFIREVFTSDDVLSQLRVVQAMVTCLETYPRARANAACARASHFANFTYGGLKNILRKALDLQPLPTTTTKAPPAEAGAAKPTFARDLTELWAHHKEDSHGYH